MTSHVADIKNGLLVPVDPSGWTLALAKLNGRRVTVDLEPYRKSRSAQQNRYYSGVVVAILSEELGYFKDEMRDALNHKFGGTVDEKTGLMRIVSTADLTTAEFEERMARIRQWAGEELGIFVPLPNEYLISEMKAKEAACASRDMSKSQTT